MPDPRNAARDLTALAGQIHTRHLSARAMPAGPVDPPAVDEAARTVELAFVSESPVEMWYGTEIISLAPGAMRSGVRQQRLPLLFNHGWDDLLGIVENTVIDPDRIGRAQVRFGKDERGEWAMRQVQDGILVNVSFQYRVHKWLVDDETDVLTAIDWEPLEITLCTVPADPSVGVGRTLESAAGSAAARGQSAPLPATPKETTMTQQIETPPAADPVTRTPDQIAQAERQRIAEIEAMCRKYSVADDVKAGMIQRGATVDQARMTCADIVLQRAAQTGQPAADMGSTANPDLSEGEKARYSMLRAINAAVSGNWKDAGFELECSNEIAKRTGRASNEKGFFMPTNLRFYSATQSPARGYAVGTPGAGTTGGTLVATNLLAGSFIEVLRNRARVLQLGAQVLSGLVGAVDIPRQTGRSATFWVGEGVDVSEGTASFDRLTMNMKTIGTWSQITRNMMAQSTPDVDMLARADLIAQIALGIDAAVLGGSGASAQPLGIANTAGVGSVIGGVNGAALTIDHLIDMETKTTAANVPEENMAYLANAYSVGALKKLKSTTGQYLWTNNPIGRRDGTPGDINGYPVARSNQARSTLTKGAGTGLSEVFFGAWDQVILGEWGVLEIVANPYDPAVFKSGGVMLRALQSIDVGIRHPEAFSVMSDAIV